MVTDYFNEQMKTEEIDIKWGSLVHCTKRFGKRPITSSFLKAFRSLRMLNKAFFERTKYPPLKFFLVLSCTSYFLFVKHISFRLKRNTYNFINSLKTKQLIPVNLRNLLRCVQIFFYFGLSVIEMFGTDAILGKLLPIIHSKVH
jgi:hypothetical protein